jgi:hypothetical protein
LTRFVGYSSESPINGSLRIEKLMKKTMLCIAYLLNRDHLVPSKVL